MTKIGTGYAPFRIFSTLRRQASQTLSDIIIQPFGAVKYKTDFSQKSKIHSAKTLAAQRATLSFYKNIGG